jgi:hypothetical protein
MQNIQNFLTMTIVILCATMTTIIVVDLSIGLTQLWNNVANSEINVQKVYPQLDIANTQEFQLTARDLKTASVSANMEAPATVYNIESLQLLIQKLPQSSIRTAARRLGIKDKIDGSYQKLGILRAQISAKLKSQPSEVERVLSAWDSENFNKQTETGLLSLKTSKLL